MISTGITMMINSVYPIFLLILCEGLMGGAVYANAFYRLQQDSHPAHREFLMGSAAVADTAGNQPGRIHGHVLRKRNPQEARMVNATTFPRTGSGARTTESLKDVLKKERVVTKNRTNTKMKCFTIVSRIICAPKFLFICLSFFSDCL